MMNWEGFGTKWSLPNRGTIPELSLRERETSHEYVVQDSECLGLTTAEHQSRVLTLVCTALWSTSFRILLYSYVYQSVYRIMISV
jgi:hypothetical protein